MKSGIELSGLFQFKILNADGSLCRRLSFKNGAVNVGMNTLLGTMFKSQSQLANWYLGLIDGSTSPVLSRSDTMASHAGWNENVSYNGGARIAWSPGSPSGGVITNGAANFTLSNNVILAGAFLASDSTLGGSAGTLFATGIAPNQSLITGQILQVTYTIVLTPLN